MKPIDLFISKMRNENLPQAAIDTFIHYYNNLESGKTGLIHETEIDPVLKDEIDDLSKIPTNIDKNLLTQVVCIKLNGGLGTTMGLQGPKSLIPLKNDLHFLDIASRQLCSLNKFHGIKIPLVLMNSFRTDKDSIKALKKYPELQTSIPQSFIQHKFPKVLISSLLPATFPEEPELEWNPPGHGDLYIALQTSGILQNLIKKGYKYAFISNIDNLGATLNFSILNYIAAQRISFLMEVTDRTWMDRKGGHLARLKNGKLILREAAQCPDIDLESFCDISKYFFFNTNNIWINLYDLNEMLDQTNFLDLSMIRNKKKLNPLVKSSPDVYQMESAMGSAISIFEKSSAIHVPRSRFAPVKNCDELLLLWSDAYILTDDYQLVANPKRKHNHISTKLDPHFYAFIDQLKERFPFGAPSLIECEHLAVHGDIRFGKNVSITGSVTLTNTQSVQQTISDNLQINQNIVF